MGRAKKGERTETQKCEDAIPGCFKPEEGESTSRADWAEQIAKGKWQMKAGSPLSQFKAQTVLQKLRKKYEGNCFGPDANKFQVTFQQNKRQFTNLKYVAQVSATTCQAAYTFAPHFTRVASRCSLPLQQLLKVCIRQIAA
jgi:hypothetical protein